MKIHTRKGGWLVGLLAAKAWPIGGGDGGRSLWKERASSVRMRFFSVSIRKCRLFRVDDVE